MHSAFSTRLGLYFAGLLVACVAVMLGIWWFGVPWIGRSGAVANHQEEVLRQMEQRADFHRRLLMQSLATRRSEVLAAIQSESLAKALGTSKGGTVDTAAVQHSLHQWLNGFPNDFQHAQVIEPGSWHILASTDAAEIGKAFANTALLHRARRPGAVEIVTPLTSPTGKPAIAWVRQIRGETLLGLLIVYTEVQELLDEVLVPTTHGSADIGQTLLFDSQQRQLAEVPPHIPGTPAVVLDREVSQGFEGSLVLNSGGDDAALMVYRPIPLGGTHSWTLVQRHLRAQVYEEVRTRLLHGLLVGGLAVLLLSVLSWLALRLATRRLLEVSAAFSRMGQGEWSLRLPTYAHDSLEIATIAQAFNQLADNIQKSNATLEQQVSQRTAELQAEHDRAQGYLNVAGIMLIALDPQGRIAMINPKGAEILGYPAAQLVGMDWFLHFIPTARREDARAQFQKVMHQEVSIPARDESHIIDSNGQSKLMLWNNAVVKDRNGRPLGTLSSGQDVTASRAAQAELRIAAIAFESQDCLIVCDANWRILRVNQAFTQVTGYTAQEAIGHLPQKLLGSAHTSESFYLSMNETLARQSHWQGEVVDRRKNGDTYPAWLQITAVRDEDQHVTHYVVAMSDITQRKAAEEQIRSLAFYDPLTNLPNRRLLMDRLEMALATCARHPRMAALLFVDLDNFKTLNDTMGHDIGDLLLQQVAERLKNCVREGDTVARLGGDEFVVMLEDLPVDAIDAATTVETIGEKILQILGRSYVLRGHSHRSTPSIGVTLFGDRVESIEEPLKRADMAMYQSKAAGRNTLRFFDPGMQAAVANRMALEADLRIAIEQKQLVLHFQPQVQSRPDGTLRVVGAEALVRWVHPERGTIPPIDFIGLAEETGLIVPLGEWVIETACRQLAKWDKHPVLGKLSIAVNVSAKQLLQNSFVRHIGMVLEETGAHPPRLKLELTESALVADVDAVIRKMVELQSWGVGFALDDFGTGYSSLAYLKRLPLDTLKIDRSFVNDVFEDANDAAIARMVVVLGHSLGLTVIAEGVETKEQRYFLAQQGCHVYQGYLFGKPLPIMDFQHWILSEAYLQD